MQSRKVSQSNAPGQSKSYSLLKACKRTEVSLEFQFELLCAVQSHPLAFFRRKRLVEAILGDYKNGGHVEGSENLSDEKTDGMSMSAERSVRNRVLCHACLMKRQQDSQFMQSALNSDHPCRLPTFPEALPPAIPIT